MSLVPLLFRGGFAGPLTGLTGLVAIYIVVFSIRAIIKRRRFDTPPICTWKYSAADWRQFADRYDLSDRPFGDAVVRITPTDILIIDASHRTRKELDAYRKCVTACKIERGVLSLRVRGYWLRRRPTQKVLYFHDHHLPVPPGSEADAEKVLDFFTTQIASRPDKVRDVTPQESGRAIFGEPNF